MRVLLISHTCQSQTEGQPKAQCLAKLPGIDLRVLVPDRWWQYTHWRYAQPPRDASFGFQIGKAALAWTGPAQWYLHWYPRLSQVLKEFRPDIIDLWEEPWGLVSAHACWLRNRLLPQTRIISETEQNTNKTLPFPFERMRDYSLRQCDFAVARNAEAVEVLREKGYRGPARVVPNAVDAELFKPLDRPRCRQALSLSGFVIGYVGRLVAEKGLADLLEALPHCPASANLLLVGSGPMREELERRAAELGISGRVRFIPSLPLEALPEVMNALNVLVLPSRTTHRWKEQFGRVIIEAHACQTPVIGSDSGAIPDVVGAGGLTFAEGNSLALAAAITRLCENPALQRALGSAGREQVEKHYTWTRVAEEMSSIYHEVHGRRPRGNAIRCNRVKYALKGLSDVVEL